MMSMRRWPKHRLGCGKFAAAGLYIANGSVGLAQDAVMGPGADIIIKAVPNKLFCHVFDNGAS